MILARVFALISVLVSLPSPSLGGATNFTQCFNDIQEGKWGQLGIDGARDNQGLPVPPNVATAMSYDLCVQACGTSFEAFTWTGFSSQFSTWLLPWLALVSQLPFGSQMKSEDLTSVFLALGSPMLAAYSLTMTVLNGQWITRRFSGIRYPNVRRAWQVLSNLQQSPLRINLSHGLLASLIVLPENDEWWSELERELNYSQTWSASAISQIAWVVIAYVFTIINSLADVAASFQSNGEAIGSLFLWLLPIVIGWLQLSPRCDYKRVRDALERANQKAFVATSEPNARVLAYEITSQRAFHLVNGYQGDAVQRDEESSAPIYNYARFHTWVQNVETVAAAFEAAAENAAEHTPVNAYFPWVNVGPYKVAEENRRGTKDQVITYTHLRQFPEKSRVARFDAAFVTRFFVASGLALALQWGIIGGAIAMAWYTPTIGLGCRSGSFMLYAISATLIWAMMVTSSFLSYYATSAPESPFGIPRPARIAGAAAIVLRRMGKFFATLNALWIILACMFQFSNFYSRCWCNSDVLSLGKNAYNVVTLLDSDVHDLKFAWMIANIMSLGTAVVFQFFIYLYINPPPPDP